MLTKYNAIVGQSGGPTAAINATLAGIIHGCQTSNKIQTLYGMKNGIEGLLKEDIIELCDTNLEMLCHTPAAYLGSCRFKLPDSPYERAYAKILAILRYYNIRYFFYIGGNNSMDTVAKLSHYAQQVQYPLHVIGVPKTIDNDLLGTDHTPGYGSAAKYVAVTTQEIIRDCAVYTQPAVTMIEIMGRDAGWLTAASAVGRIINSVEPDYVYLPERIFSVNEFVKDIKAALQRHPNVVVALSEGLRTTDGYLSQTTRMDQFGHQQLSGAGKAMETLLRYNINCKTRVIELNVPQRCSAHIASQTDLDESFQIGLEAVQAAIARKTGVMMSFERIPSDTYGCKITCHNIHDIANQVKYVPESFINAQGNHVTEECCKYILPLIQGEAYPAYQNGLPQFMI